MFITKKARAALLVMLLTSISILPGCGKNKDGDAGIIGGAVLPGYAGGVINGCVNLMGQTGALTLYFAGNAQVFGGSINGTLPVSTTAIPAVGSPFSRSDMSGDSLTLYLNGSTVYVQANLSAITVQAISSGGGAVCGFGMSNVLIGSPLSGLMGPTGQNGYAARDYWGNSIFL